MTDGQMKLQEKADREHLNFLSKKLGRKPDRRKSEHLLLTPTFQEGFIAGYQARDKECAEIIGKLEAALQDLLDCRGDSTDEKWNWAKDAIADLKTWRESK